MASKYLQKYPVPEGFHQILHDFAREVLRDQPDDIIKYGADYFECMTQGKEFKFESKYNIAKGEAPTRLHKPPKPSNMTEQAKVVVEKSNNRPDSQHVKRVGSGNPNNISHVSSQGSFPEEKKAAKEYVNTLYDKISKDIDDFENQNDQPEELPKLTSFDDRDMQNIIKIQAAAKGKIVRNQVNKNQKKSKEDIKQPEQIIESQEAQEQYFLQEEQEVQKEQEAQEVQEAQDETNQNQNEGEGEEQIGEDEGENLLQTQLQGGKQEYGQEEE